MIFMLFLSGFAAGAATVMSMLWWEDSRHHLGVILFTWAAAAILAFTAWWLQ